MGTGTAYRSHNASLRLDGATMGERVTERLDVLTDELGQWEDQREIWEEQCGYVPQYILDGYESALESLTQYAHYWGFDC
jgi:hypothetical protein